MPYTSKTAYILTYLYSFVVHVIHNYGDENISYEQIDNGILRINEDFNGVNDDIDATIEEFANIVGSPGIEFRLATKDPDGNCTYGVTRTATVWTNESGPKVMALVNWPDDQYVNIYVVKTFDDSHSGAAAYATYPGMGSDDYGDYIFCTYLYFGDWNTNNDAGPTGNNWKRHTMPHEMGHFFNLAHPWGSTNEPGIEDNCGYDDGVEDTPNTIGTDGNAVGCPLDTVTCGSLDNVQNIMDYAACAHMFTQGQATRMIAAANNYAGNRKSLWQAENLAATGTDDENFNNYAQCAPIPDMRSEVRLGCIGALIEFQNHTYNYRTDDIEYHWDFGSGTQVDVTNEGDPLVQYDTPGTFDVTLEACRVIGEDSICGTLTLEQYITILSQTDPDPEEGEVGFSQSFEDESFPTLESEVWWLRDDYIDQNWERTELASSDGNASLRIKSQNHGVRSSHEFSTPEIDMDGFITSSNDPLMICFDYAYARRLPYTWLDMDWESNNYTNNDIYPSVHWDDLVVKYKKCSSVNWTERPRLSTRPGLAGNYQSQQDTLITTDKIYFNSFVPTSDEWSQQCVNIQTLAADPDNTASILKFEFISSGYEVPDPASFLEEDEYLIYANGNWEIIKASTIGGNWLYLDNILVGNRSVVDNNYITARNTAENNLDNLKISPNPSQIDEGWIAFDTYEESHITISLANLLGLSVGSQSMNLPSGSHAFKLSELFSLPGKGSYILVVEGPEFKRSNIIIIR